jgi:hypothetical protein
MRFACVAAAIALAAALSAGGQGARADQAAKRCANRIVGTPGPDNLRGTADGDRLSGLAGDDILRGEGGADCLIGGPGDDRVEGGGGRDEVSTGTGNDRIDEVGYEYRAGWTPDPGRNSVEAGGGRDAVDVANGERDVVRCGPGRDSVRADRDDTLKACEHRRHLVSPLPGVQPRRGGRHRTFVIRFRSLGGIDPPQEFFSIRVNGPFLSACRRIVGNSVGVAYARDQVVRYQLKPFRGFGQAARAWCPGRYRGSVSFMRKTGGDSCRIRPSALPSPSCVAATRIGRFAFRVR